MSQQNMFLGVGDVSHMSRFAQATPTPGFAGAWTTIELQPDIFAPQRFTVGVAVQSPGDRLHFKLIDDFKKFECLYQERFPQKSARELLAYAEEALRDAVQSKTQIPEIRFETSCITLAQPQFTSGDDREATVERLYAEVVVMAPSTNKKAREFTSMDTPHARKIINLELKRIAQMDYEHIVRPDDQGMLLDYEGSKHFLDLNLLTLRACGSVTSAVYKTAPSVELNLLKSSRDLTTYSRVHKMDNIGLFLLLPEEELLEAKDYKKITEVIEEHKWKLEKDGFRVVSLSSPTVLASEIYEWAKPTFN
jgi:hypothetical protein